MLYEIKTTTTFDKWFKKLKDNSAKIRILARFDRVEQGNFGDIENIDGSISELRFFFGSGYRIYYTLQGDSVVLLLSAGDKSTQKKDIETARKIFSELEKENRS
jgi:putative addiction module killer protein